MPFAVLNRRLRGCVPTQIMYVCLGFLIQILLTFDIGPLHTRAKGHDLVIVRALDSQSKGCTMRNGKVFFIELNMVYMVYVSCLLLGGGPSAKLDKSCHIICSIVCNVGIHVDFTFMTLRPSPSSVK